jgi:hypothetical protein
VVRFPIGILDNCHYEGGEAIIKSGTVAVETFIKVWAATVSF